MQGKRLGVGSLIASAATLGLFWFVVLTADVHAPLRGVQEPVWHRVAGWIALAMLVASLVMFGAAITKGYRRWFVWFGPPLLLAILPTQFLGG